MREVITASSAAGVAVAFGSPIGGVLFSIEEMTSNFSIKTMWRSFFCALVATVVLSIMNPYRSGKLVLFQVTYDRDWHFFEILFFIVLGVFGGLYGAFMVRFNMAYAAFRKKHLAKFPVSEAVTLATVTAMVGYFNRFMRIDMTESMSILFRQCDGEGDYGGLCQSSLQWPMISSLLLATIIRMLFVVVSYGCKVPAGIFVPSMAIGATFGRMIGIMVKALNTAYPKAGIFSVCKPDIPCITPGTYAFLGAAAALSGVMRITVTVVVIMFELTGALTYILPTMIVILVTKAVGDFLGTRGIADEAIRFNGYPFLENDEHAYNVPVSRVMRSRLVTLPATGQTVRDIQELISSADVKGFPIISNDLKRTLLGYIEKNELRYVIDKAKRLQDITLNTLCSFAPSPVDHDDVEIPGVEPGPGVGIDEDVSTEIIDTTASADVLLLWPWVNQTPLTVSPQLPLEIVMQLFRRMGPRVIIVEDHGSLAGLITIKDVLRFTIAEESSGSATKWDHESTTMSTASSVQRDLPTIGATPLSKIFFRALKREIDLARAWRRRKDTLPISDGSRGWMKLAQKLQDHDISTIGSYKEDIDTLLVFAGLFSAVLATFSVESYKLLQPDFAQASVIILSQISQQLNSFSINPSFVNASQQVAPQLLTSFEPSRSVVLINVFWFLSLAFSLATASLAMLVKQWLRAYLSNDSTSPQAQVRVRHFRHNALLKWNVFQIASILPSFLQFALALFFIALSIFLHQFHRTLWIVVTMAIALWFAFYGFVLSGPIFASSCPYKTPSLDTFVDSLRYSLHRFLRGFLLSFLPSNLVSIETTQEKEIRTTTEHDADIWNRAETIFFDDQLVKDTVAVWFGKAKGSHVLQCVQEMFRRREPRDEPQNLPDHGHDSVSLVLVDGIMRGIESQAGEPEKFQWHQWMAQSFCILADGQRFCSKEGTLLASGPLSGDEQDDLMGPANPSELDFSAITDALLVCLRYMPKEHHDSDLISNLADEIHSTIDQSMSVCQRWISRDDYKAPLGYSETSGWSDVTSTMEGIITSQTYDVPTHWTTASEELHRLTLAKCEF
ncbi:hypothetical protein NLI96_g830 [Meripilus lineatus]|uniref:Chloride channel protein n=1 Tax=Meripilus lineatus TaxID=2056292 RepID=A0AAD5YI46_9APHY|nr:hypothetical protein NLI96_g830 [Physisporinus lineatus]